MKFLCHKPSQQNKFSAKSTNFVCWLGLWLKIVISLSILVSGLCMLHSNFYCIFSLASLGHNLVSGMFIALVMHPEDSATG
jgi:hypothetical protein